jgi:hypothetical protein
MPDEGSKNPRPYETGQATQAAPSQAFNLKTRVRFPLGGGNYIDTLPPLPPCFCYEYQNKGVRSVDLVMNIKTKDLAPNVKAGDASRLF